MSKTYFKNDFVTIYQDSEDKFRLFLTGTAICFVYNKQQVDNILGTYEPENNVIELIENSEAA